MTEDAWRGDERRAIQVHIINYIDERLNVHTAKVEQLMKDHVGEEMARYSEIIELIEKKDKASEDRHYALVQSITAYTGHVEMVQAAFLEDEKGRPDFEGHRYDHDKRKRFAIWWAGVKDKAITKVIEWGALAFVVWVVHSMWEAFLKGPNK